MNEFRLHLKNEKQKFYERFTLFIYIINFAIFIYLGITAPMHGFRATMLAGAICIALFSGFRFYLKKYKKFSTGIFSYMTFFFHRAYMVYGKLVDSRRDYCFYLFLFHDNASTISGYCQ